MIKPRTLTGKSMKTIFELSSQVGRANDKVWMVTGSADYMAGMHCQQKKCLQSCCYPVSLPEIRWERKHW